MKRKAEEPFDENQKRSKKHLIIQIVAIALVIVAGLGVGFYFGNFYLATKFKKVDYSQFNEEDILPDFESVLEKNAGKSVAEVSAVDAFVLAQYNFEHAKSYTVSSKSSLSHNYGKQSIYVEKSLENGVFSMINISTSSMKNFATKVSVTGDTVELFEGSVTSDTTADWSTKSQTYSQQEYKDMNGVAATALTPYIVSEKTLSENDSSALSPRGGIRLQNGNYKFSIKLNTTSSVLNYVKQIKYSSGISELPTFNILDISFEIDQNFNFVSITSNEEYSFKYVGGIFVTCRGTITTNYLINNN